MVGTLRVFLWWFIVGATMALAVIMLQGGIREVMQAQGSVWELKLVELLREAEQPLNVGVSLRAALLRQQPFRVMRFREDRVEAGGERGLAGKRAPTGEAREELRQVKRDP